MKRLIPLCVTALLSTGAVQASPLCDAFTSADAMPSKYRKLAPVLSGASTDWIITSDQMDTEYALGGEAARLMADIVAEFEVRGTKLAILMSPPRPLVAGQAKLEELAGGPVDFDVIAVTASFNQMIEDLRGAGVIAPNLLDVATRSDDLRDAYYYRHDTHWTPRGAAESAVALADAVVASDVAAFAGVDVVRPEIQTDTIFSERGSLAKMAEAVCGVQVKPVDQAIPSFPKPELGLFDDTSARPRIVLAGSSFSNRYNKDAYRVADAIGGALQADVINHSVSGGGAIGGIEGVVNANLLDGADLVIWELPYTEGLRSLGMLRQLLGALQFDPAQQTALLANLDNSGKVRVDLDGDAPNMLVFQMSETKAQRVKIDLRYEDGSKQTLGLVRKDHVPAVLKSDWWAVSLQGLKDSALTSAIIRYNGSDMTGAESVYTASH